tara:strand:- start:75 stop:1622 length:1548 start_codon:yes stop_codon:yes gene_type:complete
MSDLKGRSIASTYKNLIQSSSEISNTTLKQVQSGSGNNVAMKLSTDKAVFPKVGIGNTGSTPDGLLHVLSTSAGSVTANSLADEVVLESSTNTGLSILSGASSQGNMFFGDSNDNDVGKISYNHADDSFSFSTNGSVSMTLDKNANLKVNGIISQSEDRYFLDEYFHKLPYKDIQDAEITQSGSATDAVTSNTKNTRITTVANDLAANDSQEFTFNNTMIHTKSYIHAVLVDTSATVGDNAAVVVMAYDIANGSCKIRISNANVDISSMTFTVQVTVDPHIDANDHWALDGTNSSENNVSYAGAQPGLRIYSTSGDNDQVILHPKIGNQGNNTDLINTSPWRNVNFYPEYQTELNVAISTHSDITNTAIWAGMKLSTAATITSDNDKAYFLYSSDDDTETGTLTNNGNLHFIYSIGGTDYITDLGVAVTASTVYRLKLAFDENRKISVFVNDIQYGLTSTPTTTTAGGVTESVSTSKSLAMTATTQLKPVVALQNLSATTKFLYCHFIKISRTLA